MTKTKGAGKTKDRGYNRNRGRGDDFYMSQIEYLHQQKADLEAELSAAQYNVDFYKKELDRELATNEKHRKKTLELQNELLKSSVVVTLLAGAIILLLIILFVRG